MVITNIINIQLHLQFLGIQILKVYYLQSTDWFKSSWLTNKRIMLLRRSHLLDAQLLYALDVHGTVLFEFMRWL